MEQICIESIGADRRSCERQVSSTPPLLAEIDLMQTRRMMMSDFVSRKRLSVPSWFTPAIAADWLLAFILALIDNQVLEHAKPFEQPIKPYLGDPTVCSRSIFFYRRVQHPDHLSALFIFSRDCYRHIAPIPSGHK